MGRIAFAIVCLLGLGLGAGSAHARKENTFRYPVSRVWEAAVRMVRVDYGSPIGERNREDGYFLFDFVHQGEPYAGSVEVIPVGDGEVRVVVQISGLPSYVERMLLDRLEKKLRADYGDPVEKKPAAPEKKPDGDGDGAKKPGDEKTKSPASGPGDKAK